MTEDQEERAAIMEIDGGFDREYAEYYAQAGDYVGVMDQAKMRACLDQIRKAKR